MVLDPIPQSLPVHFFGSRPQPPTSRYTSHRLVSPLDLEICFTKAPCENRSPFRRSNRDLLRSPVLAFWRQPPRNIVSLLIVATSRIFNEYISFILGVATRIFSAWIRMGTFWNIMRPYFGSFADKILVATPGVNDLYSLKRNVGSLLIVATPSMNDIYSLEG